MEKEIKKETKSTIQKTKTVDVETKKGGKYSYRYTELADINAFIEELGERYYQYIRRIDGDDYIITKRIGKDAPQEELQGCRVVQAPTTNEYSNPAQEQGSALTYARRYSLLMAYGLATDDDDANSLNREKEKSITTKEEAENYVLSFGKHKGETLADVVYKDFSYIEWLLDNEKTDEIIKQAINIILDEEEKDKVIKKDVDMEMMIQEDQRQIIMGSLKKEALDKFLFKYDVDRIDDLNWKQAHELTTLINEKLNKENKKKEEVF